MRELVRGARIKTILENAAVKGESKAVSALLNLSRSSKEYPDLVRFAWDTAMSAKQRMWLLNLLPHIIRIFFSELFWLLTFQGQILGDQPLC